MLEPRAQLRTTTAPVRQENIGNGNDPEAMTHLNFMKKQQWNVA
jgi:hypothetical protein